MQYKIPQNVDIEDRVIGPLTLRQFMIILVAVGMLLILYFVLVGILQIFFWLSAIIIGGIAGVLAFGKYGDQHLEVFALAAWKTLTTPRLRIWKKETELHQMTEKAKPQEEMKEERTKKNLEEARDDLESLAELVDSGGYSKAGQKDRIVMSESQTPDDSGALDVLSAAERSNSKIDPLMERTQKAAPKREPLVSEVAGVSPNKSFDHPQIEVKNDGFLNELQK